MASTYSDSIVGAYQGMLGVARGAGGGGIPPVEGQRSNDQGQGQRSSVAPGG